jgi:hypothetical protein
MRIVSTGESRIERGAALPATLMLIAAASLTALSALRSAATEARLIGSLRAASSAFNLAEQGIAAGLQLAHANTALLPDSAPLTLPVHTIAGVGSVTTLIQPGTHDNHCPTLAPLPAVRSHFEIRATGTADPGARTTHVQGFYVCREICTGADCIAVELPPVRSYWQQRQGAAQ